MTGRLSREKPMRCSGFSLNALCKNVQQFAEIANFVIGTVGVRDRDDMLALRRVIQDVDADARQGHARIARRGRRQSDRLTGTAERDLLPVRGDLCAGDLRRSARIGLGYSNIRLRLGHAGRDLSVFVFTVSCSAEVIAAMKEHGAVYFGAIGGAGALLAKCIKSAELIAYEDLGAEALRKLYVEDMPLVVIIDSEGNNLYELGREEYLSSKK